MFSFLKRAPEPVANNDAATILKLQKESEVMKATIERLARRLVENSLAIKDLNADVQRIDSFNESIAEYGTDGSIELKKHECQLAGLWAWRAATITELSAIKAKL